jgi:hypothetical protein
MKPSELLELILERPALYLGHSSVPLLFAFLHGYECARQVENPTLEDPVYYGFHDWIVERFGFGHSHDCASIISFMGVSEASAFELTKELWAEYKDLLTKTE